MAMKRHFDVGLSSRNSNEVWRIDHTSMDGSRLIADEGASRAKAIMASPQFLLLPPRDTASKQVEGLERG